MKKFLIAMLLVMALATAVFAAAEPGYLLAPSAINPIMPDGSNGCSVTFGETCLRVTSTGNLEEGSTGDPYFMINTELDSKYEWIKMRIKNLSDAPVFEFHFASTPTDGKITAATCTHFPITTKDEEYKEYIFNIKEYNLKSQNVNEDVKLENSVWDGTINVLRFDCMWIAEPSGQVPLYSVMEIDYIALFETEEDAKAYVLPEKETLSQDYSGIEWDKNSPHFILSDPEEAAKWIAGGASASYEYGNLRMTPAGRDPTLTRGFDEPFNAAEYPYFAYRYRAFSSIPNGGFFFTNEYLTSLSDQSYSNFYITSPGEWTNLVMDMREAQPNNWRGNIDLMRLDAINGSTADNEARIYINRLGFFKTKEEAYAFLADGTSEDYSTSGEFRGQLYKAMIPGGTLSDGYDQQDYTLQSTTPEGEGHSPVVIRTNSDGTQSIVALGFTNEYGYTTYVANAAGKYTLGYNHKDYTDIAGHWGESYIDFVSDRTLFGGTSPTEFSPDETMTRGMFVTVLGRMHGVDTSKYDGNTGYTDVPADMYYAPYIQWAKIENIMAGVSDTEFAPEEPITRMDMAVVINNYVENSGFKFTIYTELEPFNDLDGLDEKTVAAINTVKNVGIINGKGEGKFDPNGISTRAEVATVMERVIKAVLDVNVPTGALTNEYITRDRIRLGVWGFTGALGTPQGMKDLADLGIDLIVQGSAAAGSTGEVVLNYADIYGIEVYMNDYYTMNASPETVDLFIENNDPKVVSAAYAHHPSFGGHYITDEPGTDYFGRLGQVVDDYEAQMPGKRAFINLLPMYANAAQLKYGAQAAAIEYYDADPELYRKHCQEWFNTTSTDYICTDIYPLNWAGTAKTTYNDYIESINQIATVAREVDKEFWCCIQTYGWQANKRTPNEAEYRWQSYCMLSFGATGILLWQYYSSNPAFPSLVDNVTLEPTQAYYDCQPVMWELRKLSDTYIQYKYLGTFTINATKGYQKMSNPYTGFDAATIESEQALLVGCFEAKDGSGKQAITIVNMEEFQTEAGAEVTMKLDPSKIVTIYNRGEPRVADNDGELNLSLASGDGLFITIE